MIAIINAYGGNLASVQFAFERLGKQSVLTSDIDIIQSASHVVLPGVSTANHAMLQLKKWQLTNIISHLQQPVLGICLGMQILYQHSSEGNTDCLGILSGQVQTFPSHLNLTIPHMGWNRLQMTAQSPLMKNIDDQSYQYFVHSYVAPINQHTIASAQYGLPFSAIVQHNNFYGTQFHPERSGVIGEKILKNFLDIQ